MSEATQAHRFFLPSEEMIRQQEMAKQQADLQPSYGFMYQVVQNGKLPTGEAFPESWKGIVNAVENASPGIGNKAGFLDTEAELKTFQSIADSPWGPHVNSDTQMSTPPGPAPSAPQTVGQVGESAVA